MNAKYKKILFLWVMIAITPISTTTLYFLIHHPEHRWQIGIVGWIVGFTIIGLGNKVIARKAKQEAA